MDINKVFILTQPSYKKFGPVGDVVSPLLFPLGNQSAFDMALQEVISAEATHCSCSFIREHAHLAEYIDACKNYPQSDCNRTWESKLTKVHFSYTHTSVEQNGLGNALLSFSQTIGKEHIGVVLPHIVHFTKSPLLPTLMRLSRQEKASIIAVQEVPANEVAHHDVIDIKKQISSNIFHVSRIVKRPSIKDTPSNLAVVGRYVLSYRICTALQELSQYASAELELTEGITQMIHNNERVFAYKVPHTCKALNSIDDLQTTLQYTIGQQLYTPLHEENSLQIT